jgi:hypothetical protein
MQKRNKGMVLPIVVAVVLIFIITGLAILTLAEQEAILGRVDTDKARAFYLAEAGIAKMQEQLQNPFTGVPVTLVEETLEPGRYIVEMDVNHSPCYAISTGVCGNIQKKIRVQANFLAAPFEDAVYARNADGSKWTFQLRGKGAPVASPGREKGGRDVINGNVFVNGDVFLYEQSQVNPAPAPNKYNLHGDVEATGNVSVLNNAVISGITTPDAQIPDLVDLTSMDYATNNTHNVSQVFSSAAVTSGHLPSGNLLRDIFVKNPSDRSTECASTPGNDYFLEPSSGFVFGTEKTGATPVHMGNNRIYYVDGDVWVHSQQTYGFLVDGKVTIVATGNIHICDNIQYANKDSMLGLVALGKYDSSGNLVSGGDIYFGDPRFGTMYMASAMMFAANDFLFNTDAVSRNTAEPTSGFTINGSFAAMGQVKIERDWYNKVVGSATTAMPAHFDPATSKWTDSRTGAVLSSTETNSIRHYQMIVNYDARVRSPETQPPGLPRGGTKIFTGFSNWEEL